MRESEEEEPGTMVAVKSSPVALLTSSSPAAPHCPCLLEKPRKGRNGEIFMFLSVCVHVFHGKDGEGKGRNVQSIHVWAQHHAFTSHTW